ncbi:MAG: protein kinase domain-containing protein [Acidimicrobiales bacterium]
MPLISDSIGRVLGKRYRLISALGSGASAHVYLAEDVTLQRLVAVKVLQPALARDEGFLRRFRAEARAVAALNHPHILRVFDWGEDADGPYLVVEHLGGGSLRDVLDRGVRLDHAQAARVGAQVADALAYAHSRGLVHRDVKPANLLFDEEGRVRVADFGVARALAEAAWTEPSGAMVGTARYASPEQAEGRNVDGRADVYALALVLYESLTGEVPFVADTTTATLRARVGAPLPRHQDLGPLDDVLARAAAPDAAARIDAASLAGRLEALGSGLLAPGPLPLAGAGAGAGASFDEGTVMAPASPDPVASPAGAAPPPVPPGHRPRRHRRWPWGVAAVALVVVAGGAAAAVATKVFVPSHPVPKLVDQPVAAARTAAAADHFTLVVGAPVHSVSVEAGSVVQQRPGPGTSLKQGSTVVVVPSAGVPMVTVPSLSGSGINCTAADRLLAQAHLKADCPALEAYTDHVAAGDVINWSQGGGPLDPEQAPYGSTVSVAVSRGHGPVPVPTFGGQTFTQAGAALKALGLVTQQSQTFSTSVPAGQVITTTPATGATAPYGSTVLVKVSKGPQMVTVPTVAGDSVGQATSVLQKTGLTVGPVYGPAHGKVFTSVPLAGQQEKVGSAVTLYTQ